MSCDVILPWKIRSPNSPHLSLPKWKEVEFTRLAKKGSSWVLSVPSNSSSGECTRQTTLETTPTDSKNGVVLLEQEATSSYLLLVVMAADLVAMASTQ